MIVIFFINICYSYACFILIRKHYKPQTCKCPSASYNTRDLRALTNSMHSSMASSIRSSSSNERGRTIEKVITEKRFDLEARHW